MIYGLNLSDSDAPKESSNLPFNLADKDVTPQKLKKSKRGSKGANDTIKKLHEFARAGKALEAEQLLEHMKQMYCFRGRKDLKPDVRHFNSGKFTTFNYGSYLLYIELSHSNMTK